MKRVFRDSYVMPIYFHNQPLHCLILISFQAEELINFLDFSSNHRTESSFAKSICDNPDWKFTIDSDLVVRQNQ